MDRGECRREVEEAIEFPLLCQQFGYEDVESVTELIVDTLCSTRPTFRIGGAEMLAEQVKGRLQMLDNGHLEYVFDCMRRNTTEIRNIRAYWTREEVEETGPDGQTTREQKWVKKTGFTTATVFDISQTEGREVPKLGVESLTGTVEGYEKLLSALKSLSPVTVVEGDLPPGVHGAYHHAEKKITLRSGMSEAQTIKTLIHEMAHAKLHALPAEGGIVLGAHEKNRRTREVEAESIAYTVCQYLGLDTGDYSFGYITGWSSGKEQKELRSSLECIRDTAAKLIDGIESYCLESPLPEPVPQRQKKRAPSRKKQARTAKVPSI